MTAADYDLAIKQGEDLDFTVTVYSDANKTVIQNMTGWTAKMQVKSGKTGTVTVYATYTSSDALSVNGPAGQVTLHVAGSTTAGYTWSTGVYDLFVYGPSNNPIKCVAQGDATVTASVTT